MEKDEFLPSIQVSAKHHHEKRQQALLAAGPFQNSPSEPIGRLCLT